MSTTTTDTSPTRHSPASYSHEKDMETPPATSPALEEHGEDADTLSFREHPPPLNYTLRTPRRERYIAIFFTLLFVETGILPLILYYSLQWGAHLSTTKNLAIITSLVGTVSGLKVTQRTYQLWFRVGHESRRPIGAGRWGVDTTQCVPRSRLYN